MSTKGTEYVTRIATERAVDPTVGRQTRYGWYYIIHVISITNKGKHSRSMLAKSKLDYKNEAAALMAGKRFLDGIRMSQSV